VSADNTIVILQTWSNVEWLDGYACKCVEPYKVWRVAHVQAWDNFEWFKENQPYNVGAFLDNIFGKCKKHKTLDAALVEANNLYEEIGYVEYGIQVVNTDYYLYGE